MKSIFSSFGLFIPRATNISMLYQLWDDDVLLPLRKKVLSIRKHPEIRKRLHPWHQSRLSIAIYAAFISHGPLFAPMDYILISADKAR